MTYSIGDEVSFVDKTLGWSSDWDSTDIFGEDYPHGFVIGLYIDMTNDKVSYYIDLRTNTVMTIFTEDENGEDVEAIWNEEYYEC